MRFFYRAFDFANVVVVLLGLVACLAFVVTLSTEDSFVRTVAKNPGTLMDFRVDYVSGSIASSADRTRLYESGIQENWFRSIATFGNNRLPVSYFPYSPIFLLVTLPLSLLPMHAAFLAWTIAGWLLCAAGLLLLRPVCQLKGLSVPVVLGALASVPSARCLVLGQMSYFFAALLSFYFRGLIRRNDWLAATMLTIMAVKPQVFIFFVLPMVALGRWRALAFMAVFAAALVAAVSILVDPAVVLAYPAAIAGMLSKGHQSANPQEMVCFRGFVTGVLPEKIIGAVTWAVALWGMVTTYVIWRKFGQNEKCLPWLISVSVLLYVLTGPHVHLYDCLLLGAAAICTMSGASVSHAAHSRGALRFWHLLLLAYPLFGWSVFLALGDEGPVLFKVHTVLNALLLVCAIARLRANVLAPSLSGDRLH